MKRRRDHARCVHAWWAAVAVLSLLPGVLAPTPASAEDPAALVEVTLKSFTPALPSRDDTLTISGTIHNVTDGPLYNLQVFNWSDRSHAITTPKELEEALASDATDPEGERVTDGVGNPLSPTDTLLMGSEALEADDSLDFTTEVPVSELKLTDEDGVFLIGVQVRGDQDGTALRKTLGRTRTLLPLITETPATKLQLTSVVALSSTPSMVSPDVLADERLSYEVAPGGRLDMLLTAAAQPGNSYAVDPSLIDELRAMADGYEVLTGDGAAVPGAGAEAATDWLARFDQLRPSQDGFRLPYAAPDLAALTHARQAGLAKRSSRATSLDPEIAALPLLVLPTTGLADKATVRAAAAMKPQAILLADTTTGGRGPILEGPEGIPIATFNTAGFAGGPGPDPRTTPVHIRQGMLADSWVDASSAKAGTMLGRIQLISSPAQAASDLQLINAPWVERTTLSSLLEAEPTKWKRSYSYGDKAGQAELSTELLNDARTLAKQYDTYADLIGGTSRNQADQFVARTVSGWWRQAAEPAQAYTNLHESFLSSRLGEAVVITGGPKFTMTGASGPIGLTVQNNLDIPVRVRINFNSQQEQRLSIKSYPTDGEPLLEIPPHESVPITTTGDAAGNGTVQVVVAAFTESNQRVGRTLTLTIVATDYGRTGWIIAVAAGIVLAATTAFRIRQVRKERGAAHD